MSAGVDDWRSNLIVCLGSLLGVQLEALRVRWLHRPAANDRLVVDMIVRRSGGGWMLMSQGTVGHWLAGPTGRNRLTDDLSDWMLYRWLSILSNAVSAHLLSNRL